MSKIFDKKKEQRLVRFWLRPETYATLKEAANKEGLDLSSFIRQKILHFLNPRAFTED